MLKANLKIVLVENAIILSKITFLSAKNSHAHLHNANNICVIFQNNCSKTLGGVDYTNFLKARRTDRRTDRWTGRDKDKT